MRWLDKSTQRYMKSISKEEDLEIGMARRVYHEKMTPEEAVVDMVQCNEGYVTVEESIDAWNRVVSKNMMVRNTTLRLFLIGLIVWILAFILAI